MEFKKTARRLGRKTGAAVRAGGQALARAPRALKRRYSPTATGKRHAENAIQRHKTRKELTSVANGLGKAAWKILPPAASWRAMKAGGNYIKQYRKAKRQTIHKYRVAEFEKNTSLGRFGARVKKAWATRRAKYGKKGSAK